MELVAEYFARKFSEAEDRDVWISAPNRGVTAQNLRLIAAAFLQLARNKGRDDVKIFVPKAPEAKVPERKSPVRSGSRIPVSAVAQLAGAPEPLLVASSPRASTIVRSTSKGSRQRTGGGKQRLEGEWLYSAPLSSASSATAIRRSTSGSKPPSRKAGATNFTPRFIPTPIPSPF